MIDPIAQGTHVDQKRYVEPVAVFFLCFLFSLDNLTNCTIFGAQEENQC
jgi:hypothetical protein